MEKLVLMIKKIHNQIHKNNKHEAFGGLFPLLKRGIDS